MQSPSSITFKENGVFLNYPLIERVSASDTLTNFYNAGFVNLTASNWGTDPLLEIPAIVNKYNSLNAYITAKAVWLCGTIGLNTPRLACNLIAYNKINASAQLITQDGQSILSCLTEKAILPLNPNSGVLDFSNVSATYSIDAAFNNAYFNPVTAFAAHSLQVYFSVSILANG